MRMKPDDLPPAVPEHIRAFRSAQARGVRLWTEDEIGVVRALYPDYAAMQLALPHRTKKALELAADKWADKQRHHVWTTTESARLKKLWAAGASSTEIRAAFPGMDWPQIKGRARRMGLGKRLKGFKHFDVLPLDRIRQRAADDGFSLVELDRVAGTGRYFQTCRREVVSKHVFRGMIALGGAWDIDWNREA